MNKGLLNKAWVLLIAVFMTSYGTSQVFMQEGFNDGVVPSDWDATSGAASFFQTTALPCEGSGALRSNIYSFNDNSTLVSPMQVATGEDIDVSFQYKVVDFSAATNPTPASNFEISLEYSIDDGVSWTNYETIDDLNHTPSASCVVFSNTIDGVDVPNGSEFVWRAVSTWNSGDFYVYIDDFSAIEQVSCLPVTNVTDDVVGGDEVTVSWTANGSATEWNIEWGATGFAPGTGTQDGDIAATTNNPETITGLLPLTNYDIYVQSDCGGGDVSGWIGPLSVETTNLCPDPSNLSEILTTAETSEFSWTENGSATEWNIEWGAVGFAPGTGAQDGALLGTTNNPETITGLTPSSTYDVYVQADCGAANGQSIWVGPLEITTPAACSEPINLNTDILNATEVEFSWTELGNSTEWNIEYGLAGFTPGTGTEEGAINNTTNLLEAISGLTTGEEYDFYVQADCGGSPSGWSGPSNVLLDYCPPVYSNTTEWLEYFETNNASQDFLYTASAQPAGGLDDLKATDTLKQFEGLNVDFDYTYSYNGSNTVKVWVDWDNNLEFDAATEEVFSLGASTPNQSGTMTIPSGTPTGVYAMRIRSTYGSTATLTPCGSNTWGSTVDIMFEVEEIPSCPKPIEISLIEATESSLEIEWDDLGAANSYTIEWGEPGFTPGTGDEEGSLSSTTLEDVITGLDPTTTYDIYIQADCGGGDTSDWSNAATYTTICDVFAAPFIEDFDGTDWVSGTGFNNEDSEISECWKRVPNTSTNFFWGTREGTTSGSFNTGPEEDVSGNGNYIFTESSNGSFGSPDTAVFHSPRVDLSTINDAQLTFSYFMRGDDIDSLNVYISNDNGVSWDSLLTIENAQQTAIDDAWIDTVVSLDAYEMDTVIIRFLNVKGGSSDDIAIDEFSILSCIPDGGVDNEADICRLDEEINLNDQITINQGGGKWSFPPNQSAISNNLMLDITSLPAGAYDAYYIVPGACEDDTTTATLNIFPPSSAGENGTLIVCRNEPVDLFSGLGGNVDLGGTWYDPSDNALPNSQPFSSNIQGSYNYDYVVSNGVCPADTQFVELLVDECDWLSVEEEEMTKIEVYPNPASEILNINNGSSMENMTIEMFDMNGRLVYSDDQSLNNTDNTTISIDHLEKGIYTLRVGNNEGQKTFKIVKH